MNKVMFALLVSVFCMSTQASDSISDCQTDVEQAYASSVKVAKALLTPADEINTLVLPRLKAYAQNRYPENWSTCVETTGFQIIDKIFAK